MREKMQQKVAVQHTAKSLRINQFDSISDSPGYDVELWSELKFLAESPIAGVIAKYDADGRSKPYEVRDDDEDNFEFTFEGIDRNSSRFPSAEIFPIFDRTLLLETEAIGVHNDHLQTNRSSSAILEKSISSRGSRTRRWGVNLREILLRRSHGSGKESFVRFASRKVTDSGRETAEEEAVRVKKVPSTRGEAKREASFMKVILGLGFYRL